MAKFRIHSLALMHKAGRSPALWLINEYCRFLKLIYATAPFVLFGEEDSPIAPSSSECFFHHRPAQDPCCASMAATAVYLFRYSATQSFSHIAVNHGRWSVDRSFRLLRRLPGEQPICIAFFPLEPHFPPVQNPGIVPFPRFIQPFPSYSHATAFCQGHADSSRWESLTSGFPGMEERWGFLCQGQDELLRNPVTSMRLPSLFHLSRNCPSGAM